MFFRFLACLYNNFIFKKFQVKKEPYKGAFKTTGINFIASEILVHPIFFFLQKIPCPSQEQHLFPASDIIPRPQQTLQIAPLQSPSHNDFSPLFYFNETILSYLFFILLSILKQFKLIYDQPKLIT